MSHKGTAVADESPPLPIHYSFLTCSSPPPSISTSFIHVLLDPILPSYKWPSSSSWTLNFIHTSKILNSSLSQDDQTTSKYYFHPFLYTTLHSICTSSMTHPSYTLSLLSPSHLATPHSPLKSLISTASSLD